MSYKQREMQKEEELDAVRAVRARQSRRSRNDVPLQVVRQCWSNAEGPLVPPLAAE